MARAVGADHHERLLRENDLLDFLPQMVRQQDEPLADPVACPFTMFQNWRVTSA